MPSNGMAVLFGGSCAVLKVSRNARCGTRNAKNCKNYLDAGLAKSPSPGNRARGELDFKLLLSAAEAKERGFAHWDAKKNPSFSDARSPFGHYRSLPGAGNLHPAVSGTPARLYPFAAGKTLGALAHAPKSGGGDGCGVLPGRIGFSRMGCEPTVGRRL